MPPSQEVDLIREQVQQLISLPMWMCLLPVSCLPITLIKFLWLVYDAHQVMTLFDNFVGHIRLFALTLKCFCHVCSPDSNTS